MAGYLGVLLGEIDPRINSRLRY